MSPADCPRGPEEHQEAARELVIREDGKRPRTAAPRDLSVLRTTNDPFYCGTPADLANAEWFAGLWSEHGTPGAHLRHIHYRAFTAGSPLRNGGRHLNDEKTWTDLVQAAAHARYLGLVNPEHLSDQRNDKPIIGALPHEVEPQPAAELDSDPWVPELPSAYIDLPWVDANISPAYAGVSPGRIPDLPGVTVTGYYYTPADQPVLLEVWSEKSSVDDTMTPLCRADHLNYVSGTGYESITRIIEFLRRAERYGKPAHIFYVSDYDPAGLNMPRQVARHVQFWLEDLGVDAEVTLHPIVLTAEQVEKYNLPQAPDSGNVELDALIALHPGALESIIREAVKEWRDPDLYDSLSDAADEAQEAADEQWADATADITAAVEQVRAEARTVIAGHRDRLQGVVDDANRAIGPLRARLGAIVNEINSTLRPHREAAGTIKREIEADLAALRTRLYEQQARYNEIAAEFSPDLPDRPEAECTADRDGLLYDSDRDWLDQLNMFRASKGQPPLEPNHTTADLKQWEVVYNAVTCGNGPDGIGELTNEQRRELVVALAADGHRPVRIVEMTGLGAPLVYKYARSPGKAQMTCQRAGCGETFMGGPDARYCSRACTKIAYRERQRAVRGD